MQLPKIKSEEISELIKSNTGEIETNFLMVKNVQNYEQNSFENKNSKLIDVMISLINPCLFRDFIRRITVVSSILSDRKKILCHNHDIEKKKQKFYKGDDKYFEYSEDSLVSDSESGSLKAKEDNTENKEKKTILDREREYDFHLKDYPQLIIYVLASNIQAIVYFLFFMNHFVYASLESIVFPLSILCYAMLEYPRPKNIFFRIMLIYVEVVFFIKFILQLTIWDSISGGDFLNNYDDKYKIGFYRARHDIFSYVLWDVLLMFGLLFREYYILRIGMWTKVETDYESLGEAQERFSPP